MQFVVIDLDVAQSPAQQELTTKFYSGYIPHVVVLDAQGNAIYNSSGEVDETKIAKLFHEALR